METVPREADLSFQEKVRIFSHDYLKCCLYLVSVKPSRYTYTKRLYSKLIATSQLLEDLLDFHGAKNNQSWYFYRELSAAVRHLSNAAYSQKHIFNRFPFYMVEERDRFEEEGEKTHAFLVETLQKLAPAILEEAESLGIGIPAERFSVADFPRISTGSLLESDIDDLETLQNNESIVKIANDFVGIASRFEDLPMKERVTDPADFQRMVPGRVNEVEIRRFEMLVHNLQSSFDSYVIHGGYLAGNRELKSLRGYISITLHLLELTGRLLHFYERHLREGHFKNVYRNVRDRMIQLVDPEQTLDRTINYGLYYICHFMCTGKDLADEILTKHMEHDSITVGVPETLGFHARPSLMVAKVVQHYGGKVEMIVGGDRFDAGSVLDMQWAGGKIKKENVVEVVFTGDRRALHDLKILAGVNYGEDRMGKGIPLPKELGYLR